MLGIMIGVAGILALGITNQASLESITKVFEESSGTIDLMVSAASGSDNIYANVLRKVEEIAGIQHILPILKANTTLASASRGDALELSFFGIQNSGGLLLHGIDPYPESTARNYELTSGNFLGANLDAFEVVLVENYADDEEIKVGDRIEILTPNGIEKLRVVGLIAREGPGQLNNGSFGVIPIETAQRMFNRIGEYDQIDLILTNSENSKVVEDTRLEIQRRLGSDLSVTYPAGQGERMTQMLSNYQIGLNFLSGIALFVGAFLIYNAFTMSVVERTREYGMLRTIGMGKRQIVGQVLIEAVTLGILGSALGAALGILGARGLATLMGSLLGSDISSDLSIPTGTLMLSLIVGIGVTIFAAMIPSIQAGRVSPIAALRIRGKSQGGWMKRYGWILGTLMLLASTAVLIWNPFAYDPQFRLGSMTVFLMFGGITLVIPATVGIWEKITRPLIGWIYGNSGRVGSRNVERSVSRTTLTVAALLIGVAMILVVRTMTASFSQDLTEWISAYLGGDLYVMSNVPLRQELTLQLSRVQGVSAATSIHYEFIEFQAPTGDMEDINFMAIDPATYTRVTSFVFSDSQVDEAQALAKLNAGGSVFVSSVIAEKFGINRGDQISLRTNSGLQPFSVAAVVVDFYNQGLVVTGNRHDLNRYFRSDDVSTILIKTESSADTSDVISRIDNMYGKRYSLSMQSNSDIRESVFTLLNQAFSMFDVMAVLAVMVASLGIVNTLTMNILERTQEIGMLRAIGMTREQITNMVLAESGLMGVIGGLIGLVFGVLLGKIFLTGMSAMSGYQLDFVVPTSGIVISLIVALIISQMTAIQPARRAANTNVLEAIHYE
jgi:putative ABC transport system permease protein